ncbi:MAG: glycosyltransferase family 2 protein [Methanoregula sp.]|nr:glycosyltransferase family 2 protein [Methanoregula sp.]
MMQAAPLVSIITPSFNKGPYIEETILSIRNQTYKNIEHIVIDGGSTDETISILKHYNKDLKWISEPDKGQSDAINKGWKLAKGDIIAYLNADDTYLPDAIETAVNFFEKNPDIYMLYGDGITTDEHGKNQRPFHSGEFSLKDLVFCQDNIFQPSVFLRKEIFDNVGYVDVKLHLAMDFDYWLRVALAYHVGYLPQPLSIAKIYRDAKSSALMHKYAIECEYILDKLFANTHIPPEILQYKDDAYNFVYVKGGLDYIHAKMIKDGIRYLWKAFRMSPGGCIKNMIALIVRYVIRNSIVRE